MRKNLTISFDEDWIKLLDTARGKIPRGVWLEKAGWESKPTTTKERNQSHHEPAGPISPPPSSAVAEKMARLEAESVNRLDPDEDVPTRAQLFLKATQK